MISVLLFSVFMLFFNCDFKVRASEGDDIKLKLFNSSEDMKVESDESNIFLYNAFIENNHTGNSADIEGERLLKRFLYSKV